MKITRRFTKPGQDALNTVTYEKRTSRISVAKYRDQAKDTSGMEVANVKPWFAPL